MSRSPETSAYRCPACDGSGRDAKKSALAKTDAGFRHHGTGMRWEVWKTFAVYVARLALVVVGIVGLGHGLYRLCEIYSFGTVFFGTLVGIFLLLLLVYLYAAAMETVEERHRRERKDA